MPCLPIFSYDAFNKESDNALVLTGTTYIEPMGIYSKKYTRRLTKLQGRGRGGS